MDEVDNGIKMLVDAITEAQYSTHNNNNNGSGGGITSTPIRMGPSSCLQTVSINKGLGLSAVIPMEGVKREELTVNEENDDSSINSGYTADISNVQQCDFKSPATHKTPGTPPSPTANLRMLVAAASSALDRENAESSQNQDKDDEGSSRKMKSLALLCKRFLQVADREIGPGKEFSLEMISTSLGINRRRIYDIINVMEALEMISKQSKNWYLWHGQNNLVTTLAKLKAMAVDDPDIQPFLDANLSEENNKENKTCNKNNNSNQSSTDAPPPQSTTAPPLPTPTGTGGSVSASNSQQVRDTGIEDDDDDDDDMPAAARSVRYDKSLGVLCQKFVMLFLISACTEITLEDAGRILVPDYHNDTIYMALNPSVNPKTKVRRLYDIANILSSLGLIKKKVFVGPHHIKKPGYAWSGPSLADIEAISVARKNEYTLNRGFMRRSISSRPYLHQYEVQQPNQKQQDHNSTLSIGSAPNSPGPSSTSKLSVTIGGSKFKRSLSFGGGINVSTNNSSGSSSSGGNIEGGNGCLKQSPPTVVARPLCPKQVDYLREMKEFESEMQRHSHRYPHVASIFHEFLQKYQTTMEQTASANGRFILPKASSSLPGPNNNNNTTTLPSTTNNDLSGNDTTTTVTSCTSNNASTTVTSNNSSVVQPTMEELSNSPPDTMPSIVEHDCTTSSSATVTTGTINDDNNIQQIVVSETSSSAVIVPSHSSNPPSCRYETRELQQNKSTIMSPLTADVQQPPLSRESCAVIEKQKALERLVMKPSNNTTLLPSLPYTPPYQPAGSNLIMNSQSIINMPTSTLVNNLANSILVNVLQNNMLEAVAASNNNSSSSNTGSGPMASPNHRITSHHQSSKQSFVQHVDDLLVKSAGNNNGGATKENYYPPGVRPPVYHDNRLPRPHRNVVGPLVTQLHNNRPLIEGLSPNNVGSNNTAPIASNNNNMSNNLPPSFNPNHFLTSQVPAPPPHYTQCAVNSVGNSSNTVLCQQQQQSNGTNSTPNILCVKYPTLPAVPNNEQMHQQLSPKRPRLE